MKFWIAVYALIGLNTFWVGLGLAADGLRGKYRREVSLGHKYHAWIGYYLGALVVIAAWPVLVIYLATMVRPPK